VRRSRSRALTPELVAELRASLRAARARDGAAHNEALAIDRWLAERAPGATPAAARNAAYGRRGWADVPGALAPPRAWRRAAGLPGRADNRRGLGYKPRPDRRLLTAGQARDARARMATGETAGALARELGVAVGSIRALRYGHTYREAEARPDAPATALGRALVAAASATPGGSRATARVRAARLRDRALAATEGLSTRRPAERLARESLAVRLDLAARRILA
jgi:hypothetical protein